LCIINFKQPQADNMCLCSVCFISQILIKQPYLRLVHPNM